MSQYEILAPIGKGGMGEVYRARDTKLGRDVAIKVLPDAFSEHPERLERFEREARLLARLNQPHIATLYGLEAHDGTPFLVMELVEGETLSDRLAKGRLPIGEALTLFAQLAEGLESAHDQDVIHRDLKPSNVMVTRDGKIKILDFGLAKALASEGEDSEVAGPSNDESALPTRTKGTRVGTILGTASYMSPEQARGLELDQRTDIWSFGCCLYEALAGKKAFDGKTETDVLVAVVNREPDWSALPAESPLRLRALLRLCLEKETRGRRRDIADVRLELEDIRLTSSDNVEADRRKRPWTSSGLAAGLVAVLGAVGLYALSLQPAPVMGNTKHLSINVPSADTNTPGLALSPDGEYLAYSALVDGVSKLRLRAMVSDDVRELEGTEGARDPFFSPDGAWIGFFAERELKKVRLSGGEPIVICELPQNTPSRGARNGASWGPDGTIVFGSYASLWQVSAASGSPRPLTEVQGSEGSATSESRARGQ